MIPIVLFAFADAPSAPPPAAAPATEDSFHTDAAPRIDPVFGDVTELRASIDKFLSLQGEMDRVRDEFSSAVHETLAVLADEPAGPRAATDARQCPAATSAPYARALASGGRYLALGQQLQATYREIRRAEDLGDTLGLTPDYRLRARKAKDMHQQLLSDYREMRVAFYDQLGAELRHAGCKPTPKGIAASLPPEANPSSYLEPSKGSRPPAIKSIGPSPLDFDALPGSWDLAEPAGDLTPAAERGSAAAATPATTPRAAVGPSLSAEAAATGVAPAVWIEIDNALCNEPTRLAIDGQAIGHIGPRNKTSVRTRSGPHEVCALPASDHRSCGDAGTIRKAYLHEGWRLTIHCAK